MAPAEEFARYAVYYAPAAEEPLGRFGNAWLGRDPASGATLEPPALDGLTVAERAAAIESPARYGFHGTLKPPFALADGVDRAGLERAVAALAEALEPAVTDGFALRSIGSFLALVPVPDDGPIRPIAETTVRMLDSFRAPPAADELARRRTASLDDRQEALLRRWGYPYVMEAFRFHLTLTGRLDEAARTRVEGALAPAFAPILEAPFRLDALSLFGDPGGGAPFRLLRRFPVGRR